MAGGRAGYTDRYVDEETKRNKALSGKIGKATKKARENRKTDVPARGGPGAGARTAKSATTASSGRKKAPNYSTSPAVSSVGTMPAHRTKAGTRTTVKGGPGVTKKPKAKNSAAPTTKAKAPAPSKAKKAAASPKSRSRSSGSSVKLLSPAEARKVREKRMSDAVAAGRKKRAASGSPPKAMRGKQIRTAAMPRKKKRKGRTSYDELMS